MERAQNVGVVGNVMMGIILWNGLRWSVMEDDANITEIVQCRVVKYSICNIEEKKDCLCLKLPPKKSVHIKITPEMSASGTMYGPFVRRERWMLIVYVNYDRISYNYNVMLFIIQI